MAHPVLTERTRIEDMQIGDCIPCRYKAVSGQVGIFSELGTCTAAEIPDAEGITQPNGKFYFIKADKGLLIADRNIQTDITWKAIHSVRGIFGANLSEIDYPMDKLPNPSALPTGIGRSVAFAVNNTYLAVAHYTSPYITIYKRSGDTFTKLNTPAAAGRPTGDARGLAFSPDGTYLAVAHAVSPFVTIYKRSGDTFTKLTNPSALPGGISYAVKFSNNGTYLVLGHDGSPYITIYKRSGDTFTKLSTPSGSGNLPTSAGYGIDFSPDDTYLAFGCVSSPYLLVYKRSGDTFTKLTNPSALPTGSVYGLAFSPDGTYLAVSHSTSPFVTIYKRDGDTFTKLSNPSSLPSGHGRGAMFSSDGKWLMIMHEVSPFMTVYRFFREKLIKLPNPDSIPTGIGRESTLSSDDKYLVLAYAESPWISIYRKSESNFTIPIRIRCLSGGVAVADAVGNPQHTNDLYGAFPTDNEYDRYLKKSTLGGKITAGDSNIWHNQNVASYCKYNPINGIWRNPGWNYTVDATYWYVMLRGRDARANEGLVDVNIAGYDYTSPTVGFRPVLEFIEPDSLQTNFHY